MKEPGKPAHGQIFMRLFLVSLLSLFCEMLVIRWLATEIRLFAYFKNLPLMAAFLGLGLGFLWAPKKFDLFKYSGVCLLAFSVLMILAFPVGLTHLAIFDESKVMFFGNFELGAMSTFKLYRNLGIMAAVFVLTASIFIGLGQQTGRLFEKLKPLQAYSINIAGALVGIILFSLLSNFALGPGAWLVVAGLLYLLVERQASPILLIVLGLTYSSYLGPQMAKLRFGENYVTTVWSPYYRVDVNKSPANRMNVRGYDIRVNYDPYQRMADCTPSALAELQEAERKQWTEYNEMPFCITNKQRPDVLILGAGTGTDVASALRCGAEHIDAVELDPFIYNLAKQMHPEHPYDSPKVTMHIMDARTYLQNCSRKYDVILFALLDSHTSFSSLSSLRTDNYIFTVESFRQASQLLKPTGYIAVSFVNRPEWLFKRHAKDLYLATNTTPLGYLWLKPFTQGYRILVCGPNINDASQLHVPPWRVPVNVNDPIPEITDDWPFLFLPQHEISSVYVLPILAVLFLALFPLNRLIATGSANLLNWQMFCLGAGFMLLEVRALSVDSLLCGSTWTVNSFVIGGVMVVILLANLLAARLPASTVTALVTMTIATIVLSNMVTVSNLNSLGNPLGIITGTAVNLLPLLFAAATFSILFKQVNSTSQTLAFNIVGGTLGVIIEYSSMIYGIKSIAWFAIAIYAGVLLLERLRISRQLSETKLSET
jgi:SAM-dependent methyltransferase